MFFKVGTYKDAIEPFTQNHMSDASREHNRRWLQNLWGQYTNDIESRRNLTSGTVDDYVNNLETTMRRFQGDSAAIAANLSLVDQLLSVEEQEQWLAERLGNGEDFGYNAINYSRYLSLTQLEQPSYSDKVGVLVARGTIMDGEQPEGSIGSTTFSDLIRQAREDQQIKALVVRVDSGGGSAFASEVIRNELQKTRDSGIPVYISMGSVAASGGYWMSTAADEIWATPTTITGSIGVFSAFATLEDSLEKMGIYTDGVGTTDLASALRPDMPLSEPVRIMLQQGVNHVYRQFIGLVAEARNSTPEAIDHVAQGRVWSAEDALELGLVDTLGDLDQTIAAAAEAAGITEYGTKWVERQKTPQEQFLMRIGKQFSLVNVGTEQSSLQRVIGIIETHLDPIFSLPKTQDPRQIYASCLTCSAP